MATTRIAEPAARGNSTETFDGWAGAYLRKGPNLPPMSTNPYIAIPSAVDAEDALWVDVAGRPIGEALLVAGDLVDDGETDAALVAAAAFWWIARERPLVDGNKRAARAMADLVLSANDRHLGGTEEELVQLAARTAAGLVELEWVEDEFLRLAEVGAPEEVFLERELEVLRRLAEDEYTLPEPAPSPRFARFAVAPRLERLWDRARPKVRA